MTDIIGGSIVSGAGGTDGLYGTRLTYTYTTEVEIRRLISSTGADQWVDDIPTDYDDYFVEVIEDATSTINQYLEKFYSPADMTNSPWVRRRATYIAAYHLTKRRGDPGLYGDDYQRIIGELQEANEGIIQVPGLAYTAGMLAVMQNVTVDQRFIYAKSRVRQNISTDTGGRENLSYNYPFEWL